MTDNPKAALYAAMSKAFPEIEGAAKDKNNPHFRAKYADLGNVVDAIKPALAKHDLWFRQVTHRTDGGVCIETMICHSSGEEISCGELFVPANKNDAQGYGSALTYARRYSLQTAFGVAPEDDDGNSAAKSAPMKEDVGPSIDDGQLAQLKQLIPAAKLSPAQFCQTFKCKTVADLPASLFNEAVERLNSRLSEMAKSATDKEATHA